MILTRKKEVHGETLVTEPLCPSHIPHGLSWGLRGVIEFVNDLAVMHEMLEGLMNLVLQPQDQIYTKAREEKLIKRTVRVTGTLKEESREKVGQAVKVSTEITTQLP